MKAGVLGGDLAEVGGVMSPTSYRAAPPRTDWRRENISHSAITCKGTGKQAAHSAHRKHGAWDPARDQNALIARLPSVGRVTEAASTRPLLFASIPVGSLRTLPKGLGGVWGRGIFGRRALPHALRGSLGRQPGTGLQVAGESADAAPPSIQILPGRTQYSEYVGELITRRRFDASRRPGSNTATGTSIRLERRKETRLREGVRGEKPWGCPTIPPGESR